jgi:plastocyanin
MMEGKYMRLFAFALGVLACAVSASASTTEFHVFSNQFSLNPQGQPIVPDATINVGDTVEWVWDQGFHSVQTPSVSSINFDSGDHAPPFTFDYTFNQPGKITFFCDLHAFDNGNGTVTGSMQGTVTVVPEPTLPAALAVFMIAMCRRRKITATKHLDT